MSAAFRRMRAVPLVLLALALALAGCTKPPTSSTTTTTTSSATTSTSTAPTPSTTTTTTPSVNTTSAPPEQYVNLTHDFSAADVNATMELGADAAWKNITASIYVAQTLIGTYDCDGSLHLTIYAPNGTAWEDAYGQPSINAPNNRTSCGIITIAPSMGPVTPGTWHVQFTGPGTGVAYVSARTG